MSPRNGKWDDTSKLGELGEAVMKRMRGSSAECKTDQLTTKYGNLFVECSSWSRASQSWEPSGIHHPELEAEHFWFIVGGHEGDDEPGQIAVVIPTAALRELVRDCPIVPANEGGANPTRGYKLPVGKVIGHPLALPSAPERTSPAPHGKRQVVKVRSTKFKPSELDAWLQEKGR